MSVKVHLKAWTLLQGRERLESKQVLGPDPASSCSAGLYRVLGLVEGGREAPVAGGPVTSRGES